MTKDFPLEALGELYDQLRRGLCIHGWVSTNVKGSTSDVPVQLILSFLLLAVEEACPGDLGLARSDKSGFVGCFDLGIGVAPTLGVQPDSYIIGGSSSPSPHAI